MVFSVGFGVCAFVGLTIVLFNIGMDDKLTKKGYIIGGFSVVLTTVFFFLSIFIPSRNTMIQMFIAKNITYDRVEKIAEESMDIKESIKQDVIDIIQAVKEGE
jgi:hypothetical protein